MRLSLIVLLCSTAALGQSQAPPLPKIGLDAPALDAEQGPTLGTDAQTLGAGNFRVGIAGHYEREPLRLVHVIDGTIEKEVRAIIANRVTTQIFGAVGLTSWLDLHLQLPLVVYQDGSDAIAFGLMPVRSFGVGSPVVGARAQLLSESRGSPINLALQLDGQLPIGSVEAHTGNQLSIAPQGHLSWNRGSFHAGAVVGLLFRKEAAYGSEVLGHAFDGGLTVGYGDRVVVELTGRTHLPFTNEGPSADLLAGVRVLRLGMFELFAATGPSFGLAPGVPTFRAIAGGTLVSTREVDPCLSPHPPIDACPLLDADGDGVLNGSDACPLDKGPASNRGCPLPPPPPPPPAAAPAPAVAVAPPPIVDRDGDQVPDRIDNCPDEKGPADNQGCPSGRRQLVVITSKALVIKERVFFDFAKATIQPRSYELLNQVAAVLAVHPEVQHIDIDGHTDNVGGRAMNLKLSQARSMSVMEYLVQHGVEVERLRAHGYGFDRPLVSNETSSGRDLNRRVEFNITSEAHP
ncbi:MAG: OmpA family protein [Myxococcaceae bacterium]